MITLDISQAVFLYLLFSVIGVLILWVFFEERFKYIYFREEDIFVWQCEICAHTYVDSMHRDLSRCPVCQSYNERRQVYGNKIFKGRADPDSSTVESAGSRHHK